MYVKNSNFAIYLVLAALVGFGVSFLFHSSDAQGSLVSGDISKANVYSNQKEDPEETVIEEKLKNDEEFFKATETALSVIETRIDDLEELTSRTIEVCSDIPEFKTAIKSILSLNAKAYNTRLSLNSTKDCLTNLSNGKKAPGYEQASSNVFIGFQKIENQLAIGKAFVNTASSYLEGKEGEEYDEIADLVAKWSVYCIQDAYLNGQDEELAYWGSTVNDIAGSSSVLSDAYNVIYSSSALDAEIAASVQGVSFVEESINAVCKALDNSFSQQVGSNEYIQAQAESFVLSQNYSMQQNISEQIMATACPTVTCQQTVSFEY